MNETMVAGREMDALVAERVMGWESKELYDQILNPKFFDDPVNESMYTPSGTTRYLCRPGRLAPSMDPNVLAREQIAAGLVVGGDQDLPHFSTDIAAAWQIVEHMKQYADTRFKNLSLVAYAYNRTYASFDAESISSGEGYSEANGEHATPLAICRAALAALSTRAP